MKSLTCVKEVQILNGPLVGPQPISQSFEGQMQTVLPINKEERNKFLLEPGVRAAFQGLKKYLTSPPLQSKLVIRETMFLYLAVSESAVSGALVREEAGIQKLVYFVNKSLLDAETRYQMMAKMVL